MPKTRSQSDTPIDDFYSVLPTRKVRRKPINKKQLSRPKLRDMVFRKFSTENNKLRTNQDIVSDVKLKQMVSLDKLNCPICMEALMVPTLTQCGHPFCLPCIEEAVKYKSACAVCRTPLNFSDFTHSHLLQSVLNQKLEQNDPQTLKQLKQRQKAFREKDMRRRIGVDAKVGDLLDFWAERRWREGKIVNITQTQKGKSTIKIEPIHQWPISEHQNYQFDISSRLLVKHRTHTREQTGRMVPRGITQFRIQIRNIGEDEPLLFELMGNRRMEFALRDLEESNDSMVRFALSFERRRNQQ